MRRRTRDRRRRMVSMVVTGAVVSGAIVGTGAWLGRSRRLPESRQ
ncbi:hypothetical protein [Glycomyces tenuis]|nr:hypothetical protein [Glycomyces tenuis]